MKVVLSEFQANNWKQMKTLIYVTLRTKEYRKFIKTGFETDQCTDFRFSRT